MKKIVENAASTALGEISRKQLKRGPANFTRLSWTIDPTYLPDMASLTVSSRLQKAINTAQKCIKQVQPAKSLLIQPRFNVESPNFIGISMLTYILQPHWI